MPIPLPPPSDTICVASRPVGAPIAAVAAAGADPRLAAVRRALHEGTAVPPVDPGVLVSYIAPAPTRAKMEVRAAAAVDPSDPSRGWLAVEAIAPLGRSGVPLHLTILMDTSDSMYSVPFTVVPPLLDEAPPSPGGRYRNVQRLEVARAALIELTKRLPSRADVSVVVFDRARAETLLARPVPATAVDDLRFALGRASQEVARKGVRTPLEAVYTVASASYDPCADNRILLVTDDNDRMDLDREVVTQTVKAWADRGLELWTLSVGQLGAQTPSVETLTRAGHGVLLYADTVSEAVEPLSAALRATGTLVRAPTVDISLTGASLAPLTGAGSSWSLPPALDAGWRRVELYALTVDPSATGPIGSVRLTASSPVPGEWTVDTTVPIEILPLAEADPIVRTRVFAWEVGQALAGATSWERVQALGAVAVREDGPARELQAWAATLGARSGR